LGLFQKTQPSFKPEEKSSDVTARLKMGKGVSESVPFRSELDLCAVAECVSRNAGSYRGRRMS
jgi:hypothetical protein